MPRHKRDWKQYDKQLIHRGNLNFWVTKKSLKFLRAKKSKKAGRPFTYSDEAIRAMVVVRFKYQLPSLGTGRTLPVPSEANEHPTSSLIYADMPQDAIDRAP